jgi:hypothetical protein
MNDEQHEQDLKQRLESIDALPADDVPSGWSRRNWVHREALAFSMLARGISLAPSSEPEGAD